MAVKLSYARGSVKEVALELGLDPRRLSKWRNKIHSPAQPAAELTEDQKEIKRLQKELREAQLERGSQSQQVLRCQLINKVGVYFITVVRDIPELL